MDIVTDIRAFNKMIENDFENLLASDILHLAYPEREVAYIELLVTGAELQVAYTERELAYFVLGVAFVELLVAGAESQVAYTE